MKKRKHPHAADVPRIMELWDQRNTLDPKQLTTGSGKTIRLKCPKRFPWCDCPHEWEDKINRLNRKLERGIMLCVFCSGRRTCCEEGRKHNYYRVCLEKSFGYLYPELLKDWDWNQNFIDPFAVLPHCTLYAFWTCPETNCPKRCPHAYVMSIDHRVGGEGCTYCAKPPKKWCYHNTLEYQKPEVAAEWHEENELKPSSVTVHSNEEVKWRCHICEREWDASICNRTRKNQPTKCPFCFGNHRVTPSTSLATWASDELLMEWDYTKNDTTPEDYRRCSSEYVNWICRFCGHKWEASINNRTNGRGCPKCKKSKAELAMQRTLENIRWQRCLLPPKWKITEMQHGQAFGRFFPDHCVCLRLRHRSKFVIVIIEMDGIQHFQLTQFSRKMDPFAHFLLTQQLDFAKNDWCKRNRFHLLRIACDITPPQYEKIVRAFFDRVASASENEWVWQRETKHNLFELYGAPLSL